MNQSVPQVFLEESRRCLTLSCDRINHCLSQLKDEDIWWSPVIGCNSIGVIIQHLLGNLRQWIISGIGGEKDIRHRPSEFTSEKGIPKCAMQLRFNECIEQVVDKLVHVDPSSLLEDRIIQGFENNVLQAIYLTLTHLELHAGQIVWITHLRLGSAYREFWKPATKEQGA